jgi:DNA-binding beta-propeller fold protein YncE
MRSRLALLSLLAAAPLAAPLAAQRAPVPPDRDYLLFVGSEATDQIALVRFGPGCPSGSPQSGPTGGCARVERTQTVGMMLTDPDGPHGVAVSPDGRFYYVSTAHGSPSGSLWKFATANDSLAGRVELGNFPATLQVSPDGALAFVVNFNLHGEMKPSDVSVVSTNEMVEIARIATCTMPHGSRLNAQGTRHYSACMMDDMAVEIDTRELGVARHFMLTRGAERGMTGAPGARRAAGASHDAGGHGMAAPAAGNVTCSPTWAQPSASGASLFVACNKTSDIVEIDVASWTMKRRIPAGDGVYNLAVTADGRLLVATNKRGQSVSVFDAVSGRELARIPTTRKVVHGVAIAPDGRYAFVSVEGIGSEPGTVDVIDLRALARVASVDVGQMAGGIDVWRTEAPRR